MCKHRCWENSIVNNLVHNTLYNYIWFLILRRIALLSCLYILIFRIRLHFPLREMLCLVSFIRTCWKKKVPVSIKNVCCRVVILRASCRNVIKILDSDNFCNASILFSTKTVLYRRIWTHSLDGVNLNVFIYKLTIHSYVDFMLYFLYRKNINIFTHIPYWLDSPLMCSE